MAVIGVGGDVGWGRGPLHSSMYHSKCLDPWYQSIYKNVLECHLNSQLWPILVMAQ
jgi:hypothetical protein